MKVIDNRVGMTREELDAIIETNRFHVMEHTPYYMNGIIAECAGISLGFYNWLEGMDCFASSCGHDTKILIQDEAHLELILTAMDALMALKNHGKK
jgi:hypothetical protein